MNGISKEVLLIASAFRQALEMDVNPGNSVNATDNPHQIALIGRYSIYKAAERVWDTLRVHLESEQRKAIAALEAEMAKVTGANASAPVSTSAAATVASALAAAPAATTILKTLKL